MEEGSTAGVGEYNGRGTAGRGKHSGRRGAHQEDGSTVRGKEQWEEGNIAGGRGAQLNQESTARAGEHYSMDSQAGHSPSTHLDQKSKTLTALSQQETDLLQKLRPQHNTHVCVLPCMPFFLHPGYSKGSGLKQKAMNTAPGHTEDARSFKLNDSNGSSTHTHLWTHHSQDKDLCWERLPLASHYDPVPGGTSPTHALEVNSDQCTQKDDNINTQPGLAASTSAGLPRPCVHRMPL